MNKSKFARQIVYYELFGFGLLIAITWIDELLDIPQHLFGGQRTPFNITESIFESLLILIAGLLVILLTLKLLHKIRHLEGFLPICASCKKIRDSHGNWFQIEVYIHELHPTLLPSLRSSGQIMRASFNWIIFL